MHEGKMAKPFFPHAPTKELSSDRRAIYRAGEIRSILLTKLITGHKKARTFSFGLFLDTRDIIFSSRLSLELLPELLLLAHLPLELLLLFLQALLQRCG